MKTNLSPILRIARQAAGRWVVIAVSLYAGGVRAVEPTFSNVTDTVAPGLSAGGKSAAAWGDYDNDGRLDLLFTGLYGTTNGHSTSTTLVPHLWRNTGIAVSLYTAGMRAAEPTLRT